MLHTLRTLAAGYGFYSVALWSAVGGVAYLSIAGFLWLEPLIGAPLAALCAGGALLALALLPWPVSALLRRRRQSRSRAAASPEIALLRQLLDEEASDWIERNALTAVLGALAAGVAAGASPTVRRSLGAVLEGLLEAREEE